MWRGQKKKKKRKKDNKPTLMIRYICYGMKTVTERQKQFFQREFRGRHWILGTMASVYTIRVPSIREIRGYEADD